MDDPQVESWAAQFERDGFLALPKFFSEEAIDRALTAVEQLKRERPHEIVVDDLAVGERTFLAAARDPQHGRFKFNDLYLQLSEVRDLALSPILSRLLRALLHGDRPVLCFSLNFVQGSAQPIHIDSLYMTPKTQAHLVATWTALEDVHPDAGPLVYYPGSHKIPLYTFSDGTHHARQDEMPSWSAYVEREMQSRGITAQTFLARKGDLFIWHSDLVHGGSAIVDARKTRRSLVCHYFTESDCAADANLELQELNDGLWINRFSQGVHTAPERFGSANPFPEELYLRRYPDVREGVEKGWIPSGFYHYQHYGFSEKRPL
ncbi:MAG: phytanoyl-CoA dioxygenase family protein [Chthoniobacterales bacterium]